MLPSTNPDLGFLVNCAVLHFTSLQSPIPCLLKESSLFLSAKNFSNSAHYQITANHNNACLPSSKTVWSESSKSSQVEPFLGIFPLQLSEKRRGSLACGGKGEHDAQMIASSVPLPQPGQETLVTNPEVESARAVAQLLREGVSGKKSQHLPHYP